MLSDITNAIEILENNPDDPAVSSVKVNYPWHHYIIKDKNEMSDAELNSARNLAVPAAIDFYKRFVARMKAMMQLPGNDMVSFSGP